jgi:hypothetical protein
MQSDEELNGVSLSSASQRERKINKSAQRTKIKSAQFKPIRESFAIGSANHRRAAYIQLNSNCYSI